MRNDMKIFRARHGFAKCQECGTDFVVKMVRQ
jgi:hypothetical protein